MEMDSASNVLEDGEKVQVNIPLSQIMMYIGDRINCLKEGEEKLRRGHIMSCVVTDCDKDGTVSVEALVIQTSGVLQIPHKVKLFIKTDECFEITCTCPAGLSGKCKHSVGVLLFVNRSDHLIKENKTCTDEAQKWGKIKSKSLELHKATTVNELCCIPKKKIKHSMSDIEKKTALKNILKALNYETGLGKHQVPILILPYGGKLTFKHHIDRMMGVVLPPSYEREEVNNKIILRRKSLEHTLECSEKTYYEKEVMISPETANKIAVETLSQRGKFWQEERKKRITASVCYEYFTYKQNGCEKVRKSFLKPFCGNKATLYGITNEPLAIKAYEKKTSSTVERCGLLVHPKYPYFACSPDGFSQSKLIEVKCPTLGETQSLQSLLPKLKYLNANDNGYALKMNHKYYGQV